MKEIIIAHWFAGNDPLENKNSMMQERVDNWRSYILE